MENSQDYDGTTAAPQDLAPDAETLARLYELRDRLGLYGPSQRGAMTVSEQHAADYGHPLTFGCCALGWTRDRAA